jgi:hypothetical protein
MGAIVSKPPFSLSHAWDKIKGSKFNNSSKDDIFQTSFLKGLKLLDLTHLYSLTIKLVEGNDLLILFTFVGPMFPGASREHWFSKSYRISKLRDELSELQTLLRLVSCLVADYEWRVTIWKTIYGCINCADANFLANLKYLCAEFLALHKFNNNLRSLQTNFESFEELHSFAIAFLAIDLTLANVRSVITDKNYRQNEQARVKLLPELPIFDEFVEWFDTLADQCEKFYSDPLSSKEEFLNCALCFPHWFFKPATVFNPTKVVWLGNGWIIAFTPSSFHLASRRHSLDYKAPNDFFQFKHIPFANMQVRAKGMCMQRWNAVYTDQDDGNFSLRLSLPHHVYNEYIELPTDAEKKEREQVLRNELDSCDQLLIALAGSYCASGFFEP